MIYFIIISILCFFCVICCFLLVKQKTTISNLNNNLLAVKDSHKRFSHNIKTPLATIRVGCNGLKDYLPIFIASYNSAKSAGLIEAEILPQKLAAIEAVFDNLLAATQQLYSQVDEFLLKHRYKGE